MPRKQPLSTLGGRALVTAALVVLTATGATAQTADTGLLTGRVTDAATGAPIADAILTASQPDGAYPRTVVTTAAGSFKLALLTPGSYNILVEAQGYQTQELTSARVSAASLTTLEIRLTGLENQVVSEQITVTAATALIDAATTEYSATLDAEMLERLPTSRTATQLVGFVPGARPDQVYGGSTEQANNYQLDGVGVNHPGFGGDFLLPNVDWIEEIEVKGLGAGAEYGDFQGGLINMVTRSGGNSWRVNLRLNAEDESLNGEAIDALEAGSELDSRQEASLDVSGPLVKDKLYTFLSAQRSEREDSIVDGLSSTPDDIRFLPIREERTETKLFAKLGLEPTPSNRIALVLGKDDVDTDNRGLDSFTSPEAAQTQESPAFLYNASWQSVIGSRHLLELKVTGFDAEDNRLPLQGATPAIQILGGNRDLYGNAVFTRKRDLGNDSATLGWSSDLSLGATDHQLKLGIEADRGTWLEQRTRNGGYTWRPEEGDGPFDPNDPATWGFISSDWGGDIRLDAETETRALYLQDYVAIGSRVTLSVGARYGQWQGDLTPGFGGGSSFRAIDADAVAPRAGLVVDLSADASLVGKLHWGRYHQSLFALMFDRTDGADAFQDEEYWDWDAASLPDLATRYSPAQRDLLFVFFGDNPIGSEVGRIEGYDQPYVDQAVIGLEKTFGGRTKVGVTYVNRENDDVIALVDRNLATNYTAIHGVHVRDRDGSPVLDQNGNPLVLDTVYLRNDDILYVGAAPGLSPEQIANLDYDRDLVLTVADDAERRFDQVQLTADHRAERFDFSASLVWTSLEGNFFSVNGYDDPDGIGAGAFVFANEQTNFDGKLTNASEWEAKIRLGADLPWQLRGGFFYRYTVGDRVAPRYQIDRRQHRFYLANGEALDRDLYYSIDGERIFLEPRGNDELEQYSTLDLYLDKTFTLGRLDLVLGLDVFNLLDEDAATTVKTLVNDQQPSDPTTLYGASRLRQAPRTLRLNLALRW